ncbi:hypothetical protein [Motiliproteus sp. MSK22-1]|uniref:hypothetical protein n=1 Tax=Motiliproteus sp. MSK22-1 TaxID=1897630 RepID=UPI000978BDC7|nr:hypothetical protein [Motiliproteus sp. MSK22-1]OMH38879.1 hypothetical protein BGP75_00435 [Motiliproteus sp. MSK22-1]
MLIRKLASIMLILCLLNSCGQDQETELTIPNRPNSVPDNAMWLGGTDGGAWVVLSKLKDDPSSIYRAEVYGDHAGEKWYIGRLKIEPDTGADIKLDNPKIFGVWDGDNLLLNDGRVLKSIDEFDPFK